MVSFMPLSGLLLVLSAAALPPDMPANPAKGAALLHGCQAELRVMSAGPSLEKVEVTDLINGAYCVGYLNGFLTGIKPGGNSICVADDNMGDLVRAYVHYMERTPQMADKDKKLGLRLALEDAFPCPLNTGYLPGAPRPSLPGVLRPAAAPGHNGPQPRRYA